MLKEPNGPSAALVSIRPKTGEVVAMYGGDNFRQSQFNLAVQGERQPGSAFKPFVLATALKQGISPVTTFPSKPVSIFIGDKYWPVHNYENDYIGSADLATATMVSDNSIFAQLTRLVGPGNVAKTAHELGITRHLNPYFAIGLGADAVSPLEMARAFSTFANGGRRVDGAGFGNHPRAIARISNAEGKLVEDNRPVNRVVLDSDRTRCSRASSKASCAPGTGKRAAASGPCGRGEDGHDGELRRCVVRRVHAAARDGGVGRLPEQADADVEPVPRAGGRRRNLSRGHLACLQSAGAGGTTPESFPPYSYQYSLGQARGVARRRPQARQRQVPLRRSWSRTSSDRGPSRNAACKPNEVDVPRVIGMSLTRAKIRLDAQPLTTSVVYKPAKAKQRVDLVLDQFPRKGRLSSYDTVTLVLAKPLHGIVPKVVGLSLSDARRRLRARGLVGVIDRFADGRAGRVLAQMPVAGVAGAPRMKIRLVVGHG